MGWSTTKTNLRIGVSDPFPSMPNGFVIEDHFLNSSVSTTADSGNYTHARVGTGTAALQSNADGGAIVLTTTTSDNDSDTIYPAGECFQTAASDKQLTFHARFKIGDVSEVGCFLGFHEKSTLTNGDVLAETTKDGIGFYTTHDGGGTPTLYCVCGNGTSQNSVSTGITLADGTWYEVGFKVYNRDRVVFCMKDSTGAWSNVYTSTTYIPTNAMTMACQCKAVSAAAGVLTLDYWCGQSD